MFNLAQEFQGFTIADGVRRRGDVAPVPVPVPVQLGASVWYGRGVGLLNASGQPASDTEAVATISDRSGNGYHATSPSAELRPVLAAAALSGYPAIVYNGSTQYSTLPRLAGVFDEGYTCLAVCRFANGRSGTQRPWGVAVTSPVAGYLEMQINSNGTPIAQMRPGTSRAAIFGTGLLPSGLTDWHMFTAVATKPPGGSIVSYLDGSATPVTTTATKAGDEWSEPTADLETPLIGATLLVANILGYTGLHLVEWLLFPRPLSAPELALLHADIDATYG